MRDRAAKFNFLEIGVDEAACEQRDKKGCYSHVSTQRSNHAFVSQFLPFQWRGKIWEVDASLLTLDQILQRVLCQYCVTFWAQGEKQQDGWACKNQIVGRNLRIVLNLMSHPSTWRVVLHVALKRGGRRSCNCWCLKSPQLPSTLSPNCRWRCGGQNYLKIYCIISFSVLHIQGVFFYKKLKYVKPRLGVSTLMQIVLDTPNLA